MFLICGHSAQPGSHTAPWGWCGTHPALRLGAGGAGGQGDGVKPWAGAAGVARVHIPQQRICRHVTSPSAEPFACARCTWECWFTAVLVPVQTRGQASPACCARQEREETQGKQLSRHKSQRVWQKQRNQVVLSLCKHMVLVI